MADYDLGSVGYDVEIRGVSKSISDLKTIDDNFKKVTKTLNNFKSTDVYGNIVNRLDKAKAGTTSWIALEQRRQNLIISNMRFEKAAAQQELNDTNNQIRALGDKIALMKRSGSFGSFGGLESFGNNVQAATGKMSRLGLATQQTGYQVGDFLVQVQSGTNAFVAFGQQATQLVGLLSLLQAKWALPAMLGLSIVIPLLTAIGAAWQRTNTHIDEYTSAIKRAVDEQKKLNDETLKLKFPDIGNQIKDQIAQTKAGIAKIKSENPGITESQQGLLGFIPFVSDSALQRLQIASGTLHDLIVAQKAYGNQKAISDATELQNQIKLQAITVKRQAYLDAIAHGQAIIANQNATEILGYLQLIDQLAAKNDAAKNDAAAKAQATASMYDAITSALGITYIAERKLMGNDLAAHVTAAELAARRFADNMWDATAAQAAAMMKTTKALAPMAGRAGAPGQGLKLAADIYGLDIKNKYSTKPPSAGSGVGGGASTIDPVKQLQEQVDLANKLVGATEAQKQVIQALGNEWSKYSPEVIKGLTDQIQAQIDLNAHIAEQQGLWDTVSNASTDAIMSMVEGTMTVKDAFRKMAFDIIEQLYKVLVVQRMVGSFDTASGTGSGLAGILGTLISGARATGGNTTAGHAYLVGEQGPEIIVPSSSGRVLTNSQSNQAMSGSGGNVTVQNTISVTGSDSAAVRAEVIKMLPQIQAATTAGIIDAKRRGGKMSQAFR